MSLTGNHEAAFELSEQAVKGVFLASYENNEIPHEIRVDSSVAGYSTHTVANILQTNAAGDLELSFDSPVANGIELSLPLDVEVQIDDPPAPSINPIEFACQLKVTAPVQAVASATDGNDELVLNLHGLPAGQVVVEMPADPVVEINEALIEDGLHKAYDDGVIPHEYNYAGITVDVLDDDLDASQQIQFTVDQAVTYTQEGSGTLSLPLFIHLFTGIPTVATIQNIKLALVGDELEIRFGGVADADVSLDFAAANSAIPLIAAMTRSFGTKKVFVPRNGTIAGIISAEARSTLDTWGADGNGRIHLYTPNAVENTPIEIRTFTPVVKPGFLAVLFNPMDGGADPDSVENFIPSGKTFAQALAEPVVQDMFDEAVRINILEENDDTNFPCTFNDKIEGHTVTLTNEPSFTLNNGHIKMSGSAEVEIDCWFDPDVDYSAKVRLYFDYDEDGNKIVKPDVYDEEVDLSCLDWFLGLIFIIYGWIALAIVNSVIEEVGGKVVSNEGDDIADGTKYLAGEIHGVGHVTTELDQIDIEPRGIILSGGLFLVEAEQALMYVPSDSSSPYKCSAGQSLTIKAKYTKTGASHLWKIGGIDISGREFNQMFPRSGWFPIQLESGMAGPKSADTHHYGRVRVDSVKPQIDIGADMVADEGDVIDFTGTFANAEYEDTHKARWSWGDGSMDVADVSELNVPPQAQGVATGSHAYGNNGDYQVSLRVIDEDGSIGIATKTVKVLNVPPTVHMPDFMFAYPGVPVTLVAPFTDPGWLDTHRAFWMFGDKPDPLPATVKEVNDPPIGYGIAAAANIYETLGTFLSRCVVIDSDNGVGSGTMPVHVVELENRNFELGFRILTLGEVANEWEPYSMGGAASHATLAAVVPASGAAFAAEQNVVHNGRRSQRIQCGIGRAGLIQSVGANVGWDYQLTVWYHIDEHTQGTCRLGVDPSGGRDPLGADVQWFEGRDNHNWNRLMVRVTAQTRRITVFLEAAATEGALNAFFDEAELIPYPCPLPEPEPPEIEEPEEPEEPPRKQCVDWLEERESRELPEAFMKNGFAFQSLQNIPMRLVVRGRATREGHLVILRTGIKVVLPFAADRVGVLVTHYKIESADIRAFNAQGEEVGRVVSQKDGAANQVFIDADQITHVTLQSEGGEALLTRLCAFKNAEAKGLRRVEEPGSLRIVGGDAGTVIESAATHLGLRAATRLFAGATGFKENKSESTKRKPLKKGENDG